MQTPADILGEHGALAGLVPDFTVRPQQVEMAKTIREAIDNGESLICEAGTGTGKTFAYLVPALQSGYKVVISTGTRHLQDQLFTRDLPLVQKAVGRPLNVALLKGRANYLCLHRLGQAEFDSRRLDRQAKASWPISAPGRNRPTAATWPSYPIFRKTPPSGRPVFPASITASDRNVIFTMTVSCSAPAAAPLRRTWPWSTTTCSWRIWY